MLLIVFVHYSASGNLEKYVKYYVDELLKIEEEKEFVFVSTSLLALDDKKILMDKGIKVIERENVGYDFYSYKVGIKSVDLSKFSSVLICNDSVFGPLYDINEIYQKLQSNENDIVGMTQSYEKQYHLQSYFLLFKQKACQSDLFNEFWNRVEILNNKDEIIQKYEIGLSQEFLRNGYSIGAYCNMTTTCIDMVLHSEQKLKAIKRCIKYFFRGKLKQIKALNITHYLWEYIIVKKKFPFIKRELIDKNPQKLNIAHIDTVIKEYTQYPVELFQRE